MYFEPSQSHQCATIIPPSPIYNLFFWFYATMIFSRIDPNIGIIVLSPNMQTMIQQSVIWTLEKEKKLLLRTPSTNLSGIGTIHHSLLRLKERPISGIISENIVRFRPWHIKALNHTSITSNTIESHHARFLQVQNTFYMYLQHFRDIIISSKILTTIH